MHEWIINREYGPAPDCHIHILRRRIMDTSTFAEDLTPLYENPSIWITRSEPCPIEAILTAVGHSLEMDSFDIRSVSSDTKSIQVAGVAARFLTIWRIADTLDMLQFAVFGSSTNLYVQAGGSLTLPILARARAAPSGLGSANLIYQASPDCVLSNRDQASSISVLQVP